MLNDTPEEATVGEKASSDVDAKGERSLIAANEQREAGLGDKKLSAAQTNREPSLIDVLHRHPAQRLRKSYTKY